ncbi:hypothetical protein AB0C34_31345, partial [Nocardia sp. NPDC049220]|uniref:hypothetical protein n=1 Tax=Nocardia sp. NPDC049220 TaxID=3155273 RepID=UPI0033FAC887
EPDAAQATGAFRTKASDDEQRRRRARTPRDLCGVVRSVTACAWRAGGELPLITPPGRKGADARTV